MTHAPERDAAGGIGRVMIWLAWAGVLGLLALLFSDLLDRQHNPNRDPVTGSTDDGLAEVVLQRNRAGHYVVNGQINDVEVTFLLDTGATDVAVPAALAARLGLPGGPVVRVQTANGLVDARATRLDSVRIGGIERRDVRATVIPNMRGNGVLLGMAFLKHLDIEQRGRTLTLRQRR